jgi:hypothetical protein
MPAERSILGGPLLRIVAIFWPKGPGSRERSIMYMFWKSQIIKRERLMIPYEMRALLALHNGCLLTVSQSSNSQAQLKNQILLSGIPHERRQDLWNLKACFKDRPGILADLTKLLGDYNIDIIESFATSRYQNSECAMDIIFDAQLYGSIFDLDSAARKRLPRAWLRELYARIVCQFIEDLSLRPDGKPNIYLKRNHLLARSVEHIHSRSVTEIKDGFLPIPRELLQEIRINYEQVYGPDWANRASGEKSPLGMLVADPEFRTLTATIFYPHTGHLHVRVEANNQVGTVAILSEHFFAANCNILQSYARNLHVGERCLTDFFIHLPPDKDKVRDDKKLRELIRAIFRSDRLKKLDCKLSFPAASNTGLSAQRRDKSRSAQ